jgi:hypothetical protein
MAGPHRRYTLTVNIGADTVDDLEDAIEALQLAIYERTREEPSEAKRVLDSQCGSPRYGWVVGLDVDPAVTHDSYFADLRRYLADVKAAAAAADVPVADPGDEQEPSC